MRDGTIFLQKEKVPEAGLVDKLTAIALQRLQPADFRAPAHTTPITAR